MTNETIQYERIRAVFFDAGATLIRSDFHLPELIVQFGRELGLDLELERVQAAYEAADRKFQLLYSQLIFHREFERLEEYWFDFGCHVLAASGIEEPERFARPLHKSIDDYLFGDGTDVWALYDDVLPVLQEARLRGLTLGIVSNWDHTLHRVLELLRLRGYFDFVLASMEVGSEKPDIGIFKRALKWAKTEPNEALHIGDMYDADVTGARAVGITPILIDRENRYPDAQCFRLTDLRQLWDFI